MLAAVKSLNIICSLKNNAEPGGGGGTHLKYTETSCLGNNAE